MTNGGGSRGRAAYWSGVCSTASTPSSRRTPSSASTTSWLPRSTTAPAVAALVVRRRRSGCGSSSSGSPPRTRAGATPGFAERCAISATISAATRSSGSCLGGRERPQGEGRLTLRVEVEVKCACATTRMGRVSTESRTRASFEQATRTKSSRRDSKRTRWWVGRAVAFTQGAVTLLAASRSPRRAYPRRQTGGADSGQPAPGQAGLSGLAPGARRLGGVSRAPGPRGDMPDAPLRRVHRTPGRGAASPRRLRAGARVH